MDVGVRELKQHLSEFLERAQRGEVIRVTDRGVPKAQLTPLPGVGVLTLAIEQGWVRAPVSSNGLRDAVGRFESDRTIGEILDEDRGG